MKKYNLRCNYCGADRKVPLFFLRLILLIKGDINVTCSNCGYVSNYILVSHIVHNSVSVDEKEYNKKFDNAKIEMLKRG